MFQQRTLAAVAAAGLMLAAACTPAGPTATPPPTTAAPTEAPAATPTERGQVSAPEGGSVSFMVFGEPAEVQAFQAVAEAFEAKYAGTTVAVISVAGNEEENHQRLALELAGGAPPDVVMIDYDAVAQYFSRGGLRPVTADLAASALIKAEDFYPQALAAFQWEGEQMCLPISVSGLVVYYNQERFDEAGQTYPQAGWTWEDFISTAQALTAEHDGEEAGEAEGDAEEADEGQYGVFMEPELNNLLPFVWANGGDVLTADGHHLALDTPEAREAIQFVIDWQARYHIAPGGEEEEAEASGGRFANGELGMFIASRSATPEFRASIHDFTWDVAPLPEHGGAANILKADGLCIPAQAANPDLAWKLVEFANSAEGQTLMAATGRIVPTNISVAESPAFLDPSAAPAHSQVWLDQIPLIRTVPPLPDWPELEELANEELEHAFFDTGDADRAIEEIMERGERYVEE